MKMQFIVVRMKLWENKCGIPVAITVSSICASRADADGETMLNYFKRFMEMY